MRTFCWLDTKWLCQKSVIRSVSGDGRRQHLLHPPGAQREAFAPLLLHELPCARASEALSPVAAE